MKHFQLFLLFLIVSFSGFSQVTVEIDSYVTDIKSGKPETGVTVRVYEGSTVVASGLTKGNGKFNAKVPSGKTYKVEFSKPGKVTRFVTMNATNIDVELLQGAAMPIMKPDVTLFDKVPNVDYSFIESNPITNFYFDGKSENLTYDASAASKMKTKVDQAVAAAEKNTGNVEVQFQAKMKEAEALATQKNYADAATKFEQALMFKPTDKVAMKRLDDMDKLVKADKLSLIDGEAADGEFNNLIKAAEILKGQKKYQEAIDKYEEALVKKPKDQNALDEIDALMEIIRKEKKEKENETNYTASMAAAEGLMKQKSYQAAKDQYIIALKAKPADPVATKKKADVELLLDAAKGEMEKKKNYDNAVTAGDEFFKAEKWAEAKGKYDEALGYQSSSVYVQGQLTKIKAKLEEIEKDKLKQEQITKLLAEGTTAMGSEQWEPAKLKFTEVLKLDAANADATAKLATVNAKLEELKKNADAEANFKKLVDEGDALVKTAKFTEAVAKYEEAIKLKADAGVDKKIADAKTEIDKLKNQKETKEKYDLAMKDGDALLAANKLEEAKVKFTEAKNLDDKAQLPKDKLKIVDDKIIAEQNGKMKSENYAAAMKSGDDLRAAGKLTEAKAEYVKAKGIDASQTAPDAKIKEIDAEIANQATAKANQEKAEKFEAAMKSGDDLRAAGKLTEAKAEYVKAKGIDASQTAPDAKIKEIDAEIANQATAKSNQEKADKYAATMKSGDDLRAASKLTEAKAEYVKAKGIDATQTTPDAKIKEIDAEIANQATAKASQEKADKYAAAMKSGDDLRAAGKLTEAKAEYVKAKGIDATQTTPDAKIKEIDAEIANQATAKANQEKADKYAAAMKSGDDLRAAGKLAEAKGEYIKAKGIDAVQTAPDEKIKEVEAEINSLADAKSQKEKADKFAAAMKTADDLRTAGKLTEAKAQYVKAKEIDGSQSAPDAKIAEIDAEIANQANAKATQEKADKYAAAMKAANDFRTAGKLSEARAEYVKAKGIDAAQTAPDEKIKEIDNEMGTQAAAQEKKKQIDGLLKEGSDLFAKKEYEPAKSKYQAVLDIDPAHAEATKKIAEINTKIDEAKGQQQRDAEFTALKAKGIDFYSKEKWEEAKQSLNEAKAIKADAEIDAKIKDIDAKIAALQASQGAEAAYTGLMQEAGALESSKDYDGAIKKYQEASVKKPAEQKPKDKIRELQELKQQNQAQADIDSKYQAAMKKGDDAVKGEDYLSAIKFFNEANSIKPAEKAPVEKAAEAQRMEEAKNIDFKKNYEKILGAGQTAIDEKNWDKATDLYNRALGIKKDDPLPKAKLIEIDNLKKADESSKNALAEKDKSYNSKLVEAEAAVKLKQYDKAISLFNDAKTIKPQEIVPDTRIADINKVKSSAENAAKNEELYLAAIKNGDEAARNKDYQKAIAEYKNALNVKQSDRQATDKISEVQQIIDDLSNAADQNKKKEEYAALIGTADGLFKSENWGAAKESYEAALKVIPKDVYATEQVKKASANEKGKSETEAKYARFISDGDASFISGDYTKAREYFSKALSVKSNEDYPKSKLQQIEDILNPKIVQTGPLPNMGTPTDNSITDAQALLIKAENQRKSRTATELSEENKDQQDLRVQQTTDNTVSTLAVSSGIQEIEKQRTLNALSDDDVRLEAQETMRTEVSKIALKNDMENTFDSAEGMDLTSKLTVEKQESEKKYVTAEGVYAENTDVLKGTSKTLQDDLTAKGGAVYESSLESQKVLNNAAIKVSENDFDDRESRKITETDVRNAQRSVTKVNEEQELAAVEKSQQITEEVVKNNALKTLLEVEDAKIASDNKEDLKVVEAKINDINFTAGNENTQSTYETGTKLDNERVELSKADVQRDDNRLASVETLKEGQVAMNEIHRNQFNDLYVKSLTNQGNIATEKKVEDGVVEQRAESQKKDFGTITETNKKVSLTNGEINQSDENQRLSAKATMATEAIKISETTTKNSEKPLENKEILKKSNAITNEIDKSAQEKQVQKNYDARKLIEKIESKEVKFDAAAANALGTSYPEGVSQESFSQNGTDGLPVAVVTRRIVVTQGHGDVYIRKQTLSAITYSKNGEPSTEYIWQKETGDGKLVKNY